MQQEVFDFIEFMHAKVARETSPSKQQPALLSEQALAVDWNQPEEDKTWADYQPEGWDKLANSKSDSSIQPDSR